MKNIIKSLFVAMIAMSVSFAYAQGPAKATDKAAPAKEAKMEKKADKKAAKADKKEAKADKKEAKADNKKNPK